MDRTTNTNTNECIDTSRNKIQYIPKKECLYADRCDKVMPFQTTKVKIQMDIQEIQVEMIYNTIHSREECLYSDRCDQGCIFFVISIYSY